MGRIAAALFRRAGAVIRWRGHNTPRLTVIAAVSTICRPKLRSYGRLHCRLGHAARLRMGR
jgi:hypothetical protein